jgi:hypothetical protein
MAKFRKKPVEVEAVQFTKDTMHQVFNDLTGIRAPGWDDDGTPHLKVTTIHGETAIVRFGDWIVSEPEIGRYYPVKSDIFEATYEPCE